MKNVLVTGPCGYLGTRLVKDILELKKYNICLLVENINSFSASACKPDIIIHLASKLPSYQGDIFNINVDAIKKLITLCNENTHFVFISSDYVFGENGHKSYSENDKRFPETEYGRSKLLCEELLTEALDKITILRTSMLYGYHNSKRNNFIQFLFNSLKNNQHIRLFTDVYCRPTHVGDLCNFIFDVIEGEKFGIFHSCSKEYINRLELAKIFCLANGFDTSLLIPSKKPLGDPWPLSLNLQPSPEFLKIAKTSLVNGLKYNISES